MLTKKPLILLLTITLIFTTSTALASSYQFGGEISAGLNSLFFEETNNNSIYETVNLNFDFDNANFALTGSNNNLNREFDISLKKAYIRHKFEKIRITLGRQPISWSFGSLINPVDYSLGAEALDEETSAKYVDAVEFYYPINWYSNLSLVTEYNNNYDKYGFRARTLIKDYDVSFNYVKQSADESDVNRWGLSLKGDIKSAGVYGSYTNINYKTNSLPEVNTQAFMLGTDYSYFLNQGYGNRLYMQGEYHLIEKNEGIIVLIESLAGAGIGLDATRFLGGDDYLDIFLTNVNYSINDFSSIGFFTLTSLEDGSTAIIPNYSNQLSTNTTLNINVSYLSGAETSDFGGGTRVPEAALNIELSYVF
ncbi:MAG TPA: hypothetical protein VJ907_10185 [Halanaerobiales bacterium]|nr:hypothetical protein [Halanaerobiales bacterium]